MIKIEKMETFGWDAALRGMRNPLNSWDKSDTKTCGELHCKECPFDDAEGGCPDIFYIIGPNDLSLAKKLSKAGSTHSKFRRMIPVFIDITAPLYWWKEFDTYKVGTVANSCSTMHKIQAKEFTVDDFSHEHLVDDIGESHLYSSNVPYCWNYRDVLWTTIQALNNAREHYLETKDKKYWWQMIQLLPSSYNQKRTVMLNYEVLASMYRDRKNHKLDEWVQFCEEIKKLPYAKDLITMEADDEDKDI